jgi:hydrogenase maturation protease
LTDSFPEPVIEPETPADKETATKPLKPVLIIGVGNILCRDDGAGVHVAQHLMRVRAGADERIEILDGGTAGPDLLSHMRGRRRIIIVDATDGGHAPGEVRLLRSSECQGNRARFSAHGAGVGDCLNALNLMGESPEVFIVGICASDLRAGGMEPTPQVLLAIPKAADLALEAAAA